MFDSLNRYVIPDYQHKPTFASFLPGVAGELGVPMWCFYVNRGQGVSSFGVNDKEHAIMEFLPAYAAYRDVSRRGFRTFCMVNGAYRELFTDGSDMHIGMSEMEITEETDDLASSALYFGVPGERTAALARVLTVKNVSDAAVALQLVDGMPEIVPYGVGNGSLKDMVNLTKAWMQAEDAARGLSYFRVRASMEDSAKVTRVEGGAFALGFDGTGALLRPCVEQEVLFGEDTAFELPEGLLTGADLAPKDKPISNSFPCCMMTLNVTLQPGESASIRTLYGHAESKQQVAALAESAKTAGWFEEKRAEVRQVVEGLCSAIHTRTGDAIFDAYCKQTYLDNLLRGGVPVIFRSGDKHKPFYLYSRKHGDPEREYNAFSLGGEYFAQGNGNYRDVSQNRRSDILFCPEVGEDSIRTFYELIQPDGYNPLVLKAATFRLDAESAAALARECPGTEDVLKRDFTPGQLAMAAESAGLPRDALRAFVAKAVCLAENQPTANFQEGYWCDHWTYNIDLVENFLGVWPEKKAELLFGAPSYRWYAPHARVNPRRERYQMTEGGLRQYNALTEKPAGAVWVMDGQHEPIRSTLAEKLIHLCTVKATTLDGAGMGIEMEGGKPGWYDALNGLPGLLGSSMAETCELQRLIAFVEEALREKGGDIDLHKDVATLLDKAAAIAAAVEEPFARWQQMNDLREAWRETIYQGMQAETVTLDAAAVAAKLDVLGQMATEGVCKATAIGNGICPTYFTFETDGMEDGLPVNLKATALPLFLEGPVHAMKLPGQDKAKLAEDIRQSGLYDQKLHMYKVNESLDGVSFEAGRALAFTPGWLENESVWLHMEYKYLLELLKNSLYDQFAQAFRDAAVPFLDAAVYGRSPLENVSFIASSANPVENFHGRGFVARLSGSTAEFLSIWQQMFVGGTPFRLENGQLTLTLAPFVPDYLMPADGRVSATLLGRIPVEYAADGAKYLQPGKTSVTKYVLTLNGQTVEAEGPVLRGDLAQAVRAGQVESIIAYMN